VHAGGPACALSQVRIQTDRHLGSEPPPHGGAAMTVPTTKGSRQKQTSLPTSLPAIRPLVAGLDLAAREKMTTYAQQE